MANDTVPLVPEQGAGVVRFDPSCNDGFHKSILLCPRRTDRRWRRSRTRRDVALRITGANPRQQSIRTGVGEGKSKPLIAVINGQLGRRYPNHLSTFVEQRSATVSRIDGRIGLNVRAEHARNDASTDGGVRMLDRGRARIPRERYGIADAWSISPLQSSQGHIERCAYQTNILSAVGVEVSNHRAIYIDTRARKARSRCALNHVTGGHEFPIANVEGRSISSRRRDQNCTGNYLRR